MLFCVEICTRIILLEIITAAIHVLVDAFNLFNARFDCIWEQEYPEHDYLMIVRAAIVVNFEYISHFDHVIDLQIQDCY